MLHLGDCLEVMKNIPDGLVDAVICDPPYGTTNCQWDSVIPFEPMWAQLKRITKPSGAIVLMASQPFTSALVMSNVGMFKYCWVWDKVTARGHLVAKIRPMAQHEDVIVFGKGHVTYNPQMVLMDKPQKGKSMESSRTEIMGGKTTGTSETIIRTHKYPKTIQTFGNRGKSLHPTQKPVALMEYMIRTYTNEGETVLDFTMGSGTTGVACKNLGRSFIGIEMDADYFSVASKRISDHVVEAKLW